jgi:DUF438 domain-containing protein
MANIVEEVKEKVKDLTRSEALELIRHIESQFGNVHSRFHTILSYCDTFSRSVKVVFVKSLYEHADLSLFHASMVAVDQNVKLEDVESFISSLESSETLTDEDEDEDEKALVGKIDKILNELSEADARILQHQVSIDRLKIEARRKLAALNERVG